MENTCDYLFIVAAVFITFSFWYSLWLVRWCLADAF